MKITNTNPVMSSYTDLHTRGKEGGASRIFQGNDHNFDAITIQSNPRQIEEKTFAAAVAKGISQQVRETASAARLDTLREQIVSRTYQVDPYAAASRMLLFQR